jgi:aminopeptidase YwaD
MQLRSLLSFLFVLLLVIPTSFAQRLSKADKSVIKNLKAHVTYLADDRLEGRRTGTQGEKLAAQYISEQFAAIGLLAKGDRGTFFQSFEINDGKQVAAGSFLQINDVAVPLYTGYFPFAFSVDGKGEGSTAISLRESGQPWFLNLTELMLANTHNPHFEWVEAIKEQANDAAKKGANALIVYHTSTKIEEPAFEPKQRGTSPSIPVYYVMQKTASTFFSDPTATLRIKFQHQLQTVNRQGVNVVGYIDNNAPTTVILGAHFDHLGYGEDKNSMYTGTAPMIHNGADDNASGTAALIELARILKLSKVKKNNYAFVAFSGEELGLYGSKYFVENPTFPIQTANYMINMDMVGRLNDSTKALTLGGWGTSPVWGQAIDPTKAPFTVKIDSVGSGPSDHTSFYRKDIPVLFFFTGVHSDYHRPSDDADRINYNGQLLIVRYIQQVITAVNDRGKLAFTKTREPQMGARSAFRVTLGIMPDYTFSGTGVKAEGVTEGRPAAKAGLQAGDVVLKLGEHVCSDVQAYMQALSKFKKGDTAKIVYQRGTQTLEAEVTF